MFGPEFSGRAYRVCPIKLYMRPIANPDFLLQETDYLARFSFAE
jgi:hypothetical protein